MTDSVAGAGRSPIVSAMADAVRLVRTGQADLAVRRLGRDLKAATGVSIVAFYTYSKEAVWAAILGRLETARPLP